MGLGVQIFRDFLNRQVTYKIIGEVEPEVIKQVNAIADFALYAGVGRKTPMGMGMVRRQTN